MVEVGLAPGFTSALGGGHIFGSGGTPVSTVPSGAPFPFAGISNVPGSAVPASSPIQTAAPKTNVGIPYARHVPSVFAQQQNNLATAEAGDPVFVSAKTPISWRSAGVDAMRFTNLATVEYVNAQLQLDTNRMDTTANVPAGIKAERAEMIDNMLGREKERIDLEIRRAAPEMADDGTVTKTKEEVVAALKEEKRAAEEASARKKDQPTFAEESDFLFLPALKEWRLDGMIRSVDIDGSPRLMTQDGRPTLATTSDKSVSALVNVIVAGPARARVVEGIGYDKKFTYAPQNQKLSHRANVFDQLVLALVKQEKDGKRHYKIVRSTRSYKTVTTPPPRDGAMGDGAIVRDGVGEASLSFDGVDEADVANIVGYWRLGRCVEEPSKTDRACGIIFTGGFVLCKQDASVRGAGFNEVEL